jgi:hypothetical protein
LFTLSFRFFSTIQISSETRGHIPYDFTKKGYFTLSPVTCLFLSKLPRNECHFCLVLSASSPEQRATAMDDRYHRQFQLVIVHSITDSATIQSEVENFWEARLPKAVVTTFRFIQEDVAWGTRGFVESAGRLLKEVQRDRSNTPDLPCVILCHELGGCLVQQVRGKTN